MGKGKRKNLVNSGDRDLDDELDTESSSLQFKYTRVQRGESTAPPLEKLDGGYVLRNTKFTKLKAHKSAIAHTGIQIKIPNGYQGRITGLNKHAYKNMLTVGGGIIGSGNSEEIKVILLNHTNVDRDINVGNPVGILHIEKIPDVELVEVSSLKVNLGSGGNKIASELAELDSF